MRGQGPEGRKAGRPGQEMGRLAALPEEELFRGQARQASRDYTARARCEVAE